VYQRIHSDVRMMDGRDVWWHDEIQGMEATCPAEEMDAEDMLFILYTSGSTGKPKGMVHTCGGYLVYVTYTFLTAFRYREGQVYWCTADIGWITGHSYILYGPLAAGAITLMFEGVPSWPDMGRFWHVCETHRVNIFYTAPTAIRSLARAPLSLVEAQALTHVGVVGTLGVPIGGEAWKWYHDSIGTGRCPAIGTRWQADPGDLTSSPLANGTPMDRSHAAFPLPRLLPVVR